MESTDAVGWSAEQEVKIAQLREETLAFALIGLLVTGVGFVAAVPAYSGSPYPPLTVGFALCALAVAIWRLRRRHYPVAAWALVLSYLGAVIAAVGWLRLGQAAYLLLAPAGLATLLLTRAAGVAITALIALAILLAPTSLLPLAAADRVTAGLVAAVAVALIWLTLRPLLAAVKWAWAAYEQSLVLLEQSRQTQVRLHQTLEDLAKASVQLARLNEQAQALRQAAEDARRAKEQFVANVSHELRTPLNMVTGFCEMILRSPDSYGRHVPKTLLSDLDVVLRNSQHLSSLIDDVLDLSQIDAGQMPLLKERVAMAELVAAAVVAVQPLFKSKGLYLETDVPNGLPEVFCDPTRIREVFLNLLSNAGRFTQQGGVRVTVRLEGDDVVAAVADTGPGIPLPDQERLFQPFQQLDNSTRRRYGGTGLGLSISRGFVELHGGRLWVDSKPGEGATFCFRLPVDSPAAPAASGVARWVSPYQTYEPRTRPSRLKTVTVRPRVVVVEQGEALQRLLGRYLDGADVSPAADLAVAGRSLAQEPAQMLLVNDTRAVEELLPVDGWATLPEGVPVVVCAVPGADLAADEPAVVDRIVKPITHDRLLAALDKLDFPTRTVLIVDDDEDAQQLFRRMLAGTGRFDRILRAGDGRQALEALQHARPDAILLDLLMPEMDGFAFMAAKRRDPAIRDIPVILISARNPAGQPIVSKWLAVACREGLSAWQILACVKALGAILARPVDAPGPTAQLPE